MIKPNWSKAPIWAKWWAVDENARAYWHEKEPFMDLLGNTGVWASEGNLWSIGSEDIPEGVDWKTLKEGR